MNDKCDACNAGFFNFPTCEGKQYYVHILQRVRKECNFHNIGCNFCYFILTACNCNGDGSNGILCDDNGICNCKANFMNDKCDTCNAGFFNFTACEGKQY